MYLFVDTEANGRAYLRDAPAKLVWNWPRLVQIAWVLTDENGGELRAQSVIVRPSGFNVTKRIERERGITTETAQRLGSEIGEVLAALDRDVAKAEAVVGHNVHYDQRVIEAEYHRLGLPADVFGSRKFYCTMRSSTSFCRLPGGPFGYKWPKLQELHRVLFGDEFDSAHDATADARACAKCFFELNRRGVVDDQEAFEEIYRLADSTDWFDTSRFVDNVYSQFKRRGFLTGRQRGALANILKRLSGEKRVKANNSATRAERPRS
jgi:DNA polymerase-3 subunit epsilon